MEGEKAPHAACLRAHLCRRPDLEQARSFAGEREAAFKIGTLRPKLSMSCLELLEECQGCSASDERQEAFDCGLSASFI